LFSHPKSKVTHYVNVADDIVELVGTNSKHDSLVIKDLQDDGCSRLRHEASSGLEYATFNNEPFSLKHLLHGILCVLSTLLFRGALGTCGTLGTFAFPRGDFKMLSTN
jgi:hypothetical protein